MEPVQFVSNGASGNSFVINREAVTMLENETRPVTVVCVVGKYRTGKSYLLNRLMGKDLRGGFALGATVQAKTKGIWIWIGDFFNDKDRALVLLDTEGLSDADKGDATHDMNLFVLSLLLCSVFVYNTKGTIDADALDGLHYATQIGSYISKNTGGDDTGILGQDLPHFIWAVRDHHLLLEIDGKKVTSDEYLEFCLKFKQGFSQQVVEYNGLRDAIRGYFPQRSCFVFPFPTHSADKMNNLDKLSEDELDPEFVRSGDRFTDFIRNRAEPKSLNGRILNGRTFCTMVEQYVGAVIRRDINIQSTYKYVVEKENQRAVELAVAEVNKKLKILSEMFPVSSEVFGDAAIDAMGSAHEILAKSSLNIEKHAEFEEEMEATLTETMFKFNEMNNQASEAKCKAEMMKLFGPVQQQFRSGVYAKPGGYEDLSATLHTILTDFEMKSYEEEFGPQLDQFIIEFKQEQFKPLLEQAMIADKKLSEAAREVEKQKREVLHMESLANLNYEKATELENRMGQMRVSHEQNLLKLRNRLTSEHSAQIATIRRQLQKEKEEMRRCNDAAMKAAANQHAQQIRALDARLTELQNRPPRVEHVYHESSGGGCSIQ